jgi:hypothetical protein
MAPHTSSMHSRPPLPAVLAPATAAVTLLLLLLAPTAHALEVNSASVQLSPAVMLIGKFDWQVDPASKPGEPWSRWVGAAGATLLYGRLAALKASVDVAAWALPLPLPL